VCSSRELCLDKELFPTGGDELYLKSCAILMRDYHKQVRTCAVVESRLGFVLWRDL
jgi:hypothetical protein